MGTTSVPHADNNRSDAPSHNRMLWHTFTPILQYFPVTLFPFLVPLRNDFLQKGFLPRAQSPTEYSSHINPTSYLQLTESSLSPQDIAMVPSHKYPYHPLPAVPNPMFLEKPHPPTSRAAATSSYVRVLHTQISNKSRLRPGLNPPRHILYEQGIPRTSPLNHPIPSSNNRQ